MSLILGMLNWDKFKFVLDNTVLWFIQGILLFEAQCRFDSAEMGLNLNLLVGVWLI